MGYLPLEAIAPAKATKETPARTGCKLTYSGGTYALEYPNGTTLHTHSIKLITDMLKRTAERRALFTV